MNPESLLNRPNVRALLDEGVQTGRVSFNQVLAALGEDATDDEAVEEVLEALEVRRITLIEDDPALTATPASTSAALPGTSPSTSSTSEPAAPAKIEVKKAHADLDEVLAAIDKMSALPTAIENVANIESNLSEEAGDEEGPAVADAFRQYLDRMASVPLLSEEEERDLARKVYGHAPDAEEARQKLVEANLRLVLYMARRAEERTTLPILDIVQEGTIGLLRAIDRFNPDKQGKDGKSHRLATYATWWIRQSINRAVIEHGRSIKLPGQLSEAIQKLSRLQRELSQQLGRAASRTELSEASGMTVVAVDEALRAAQSTLSLEAPVGGDADLELGESIQGGEGDEPAANLTRSELKREIESVLGTLSERERLVVEKRFGIGDFESSGPQALEDVADDLHLSRERVRQLEIRALRKLRRRSGALRNDEADDDDD